MDLQSEALENPELILFVDGSSSRDEFGKNRAGYAVVSSNDILAQEALPPSFSAQGAELVALTTACPWLKTNVSLSTQTPDMPLASCMILGHCGNTGNS